MTPHLTQSGPRNRRPIKMLVSASPLLLGWFLLTGNPPAQAQVEPAERSTIAVKSEIEATKAENAPASSAKSALKARIQFPPANTTTGLGIESESSLAEYAKLWLIITWSPSHYNIEVHPELVISPNLPQIELDDLQKQLRADRQIQDRVIEWKDYFNRLIAVLPEGLMDTEIGTKSDFFVDIIVRNDQTIQAVTTSFHGARGKQYADRITRNLKALNESKVLQFPENTNEKEMHFDIKTDGFGNLLLECINQGLH
jgi:hypothetical protein